MTIRCYTMSSRTPHSLALLIILAALILGLSLHPRLPDDMASHWNAQGEADDTIDKAWGAFLFPTIMAGLFLMLIAIPRIAPLKKNIESFRKYYDWFNPVIQGFLLYIYILTLLKNTGYGFNIIQLTTPAIAGLLYYSGILIQHTKQNYFVGIRTPWTLQSEQVWDKTHRLGAKMFKASAKITLIGLIIPEYAIHLMIAPIILASIYTIYYSYREYQKQEENHPEKKEI